VHRETLRSGDVRELAYCTLIDRHTLDGREAIVYSVCIQGGTPAHIISGRAARVNNGANAKPGVGREEWFIISLASMQHTKNTMCGKLGRVPGIW
jgi:hypothetical protein